MDDPEFFPRAWQMQGAAWMAGHLLMLKDDPEVKQIGRRLAAVSTWFMEEDTEWGRVPEEPT